MKKQLQKSLSILLAVVMLLGMLPITTLAAETITPTTPEGSGTAADPYSIGTAEELYGFAQIVNGGDTDAHAILTADITVNENVLYYYALNGTQEDFVAWDPINLYEGIFDGRGHTISGLFIYYTESNQYDHCGFIEELRGIVRDLTISDSYFRVCYGYYSSTGGVATASANRNIGGICGELESTGTVWRCNFDGVIDADQGTSTGGFKIGGIVGFNFSGVVKECSASGRVDGKAGGSDSGVGGIVGVSSGGTVTRCCNNASVTNVTAPSAAKKGQSSVGGIVGRVKYDGTVTDSYTSYNSGSIWGYGYVGGIVGSAEGCNIQRCWNHSMLGYVEDEYKEDTYIYMGGILGHASGTNTSNVIKNCYNRGTIYPGWQSTEENPYTGAGIVGNYDDSMGATLSISYCHNMGKYVGDRLYNNASETYNPIVTEDKGIISNCYYKIDDNETGERDEVANTVAYQLKDFKNGTVVDLLNDQPLFDNQNYWEQDDGALPGPVLVARPEIVATRLEITTHPTKTEYTAGEDFDPTGMVVKMHYSDGSVLPVVGYTVSGGECMLNTVKSVALYYTDNGVTLHTDEPVTVTGTNPTFKVTVGTGGTGGGSFTPGTRVTVSATVPTGAQFIGWTGLGDVRITSGSVTNTSVTFVMPKKNVTATPIFGAVRSIAVTTPPTKTTYYAGETFDPTGMVVTAYCLAVPSGNKISMPIKNYTMSGNKNLLEGQTKVTIQYKTGTKLTDYVSTTQAITVLPVPTLTVTNGTGGGSFIPGTVVTVVADVADDQIFWSWDGLKDEFKITKGSAFTPSVTFVMPDEDVTLEAIIETIELERPEGDGTASYPFEIGTMGELYWFQRFVNGVLTVEDITVEPTAACAKVTQDITVNADLMTSDGIPTQTFGLAKWTPIGMDTAYTGTFDGQNHTISGIFYDPQCAVSSEYVGFFGSLGAGATVRNLTVNDSYFCAPTEMDNAYTGGIAGLIILGGTVENCHFDGTVTTGDSAGYDGLGGIAAVNRGVIRDCTAKGKVSGFSSSLGGIASYVRRENGNGGEVIGCVNEATVQTTMKLNDSGEMVSGGIVGSSTGGIIKECCNKGDVPSIWHAGGIIGRIEGSGSAIIRCWNEGNVERGYGAGIVSRLGNYAIVNNCYNAGTVQRAGIVALYQQGYNTISNCHNVGEVLSSANPISTYTDSDTVTITNCFYLSDSETDSFDGTIAKDASKFYNSNPELQIVTRMLNVGKNAGNWKQGPDYPVLADLYTVTVTGGTGSGEFGEGASVTVTAEEPEGNLFKSWSGLDGLTITEGSATSSSVTFTMPAKNVELTAVFEGIVLTEITVGNVPNKREYKPGEAFDPTGMVIKAHYSDGTSVTVTDYTVTNGSSLTAEQTFVTISYTEDGITKTVNVPITINVPRYTLNLTSGYVVGGVAGSIAEGAEITVAASTAPSGKTFDKWTVHKLSDGASVELDFISGSLTSSVITFRMPAENIQLVATYKDAYYPCYIEGGTFADGTTSNSFKMNEEVLLIPNDPPAGKMFSHWESEPSVRFVGENAFLMPNRTVQIQAVYVDAALQMYAESTYTTDGSGKASDVVSVNVEYLDTVEGLDPDAGAMLIVAQYRYGEKDKKMTDVRTCSVKADGTYTLPAFVYSDSDADIDYCVFIVDGKTFTPLYEPCWPDWMGGGE